MLLLRTQRSFRCVVGWGHGCSREVSNTISNLWIASGPTATPDTANLLTATLEDPVTVYNDGIPVAWERTDAAILALISQASAADAETQAPSSSSPGGRIPTIVPVTSSPTASASFNTGAKVGIGVGAVCGTLILIGVLLWALRSCKKRKLHEEDQQLQYGKAKLDFGSVGMLAEPHQRQIQELESQPQLHGGERERFELSATRAEHELSVS
ncbi:hypothetical protein GP486_003810 [Trichoglossum hirsutum]|uniref:Uncharacterized protein n=1 Tax=Trichoglossum hirsutum TaxID=265104 RepID=A0A9P8RQ59_9PEZI|nr:hypothetical protein GP486_003810 [Trichoglossum hirsutum]